MATYKWDNLILFVEQLAAAAKLNLPLDKTIRHLSQESVDKGWKQAQVSVSELVGLGSPLSESMKSNSGYFPSSVIRLVQVGEEGKVLSSMLRSLSRYLQSAREIQHKLQRCMIYPFIVWCVLFLEIIFMFIFAMPKLSSFSEVMGTNLPKLTHYLIYSGPVLFVLGVGLVFYLAWIVIGVLSANLETKGKLARKIEQILPYIPFLGLLSRYAKTAQICEVLGILLEGGHSGREAVILAKGLVDGVAMQTALDEVETAILSSDEYQPGNERTIIPQTTLWMISQGNGKGELGETLRNLSQLNQRQLDMLSNIVREILEPTLIVFVAIIGGITIVAFYMSIFSIPALVNSGI